MMILIIAALNPNRFRVARGVSIKAPPVITLSTAPATPIQTHH